MSSSIVQQIAQKARDSQKQATHDPYIDSFASEAAGANELVSFGEFGVRLDGEGFIKTITAAFADACKKLAPEGVVITAPEERFVRDALEPIREVFAKEFIPLATMTFTDASGTIGLHFSNAEKILATIQSVNPLLINAAIAQMDTDGGVDLLDDDLDLETIMDNAPKLQKKRDANVLAFYRKAGQDAINATLGKALKSYTFEPSMSSFAISEMDETLGELMDTFVGKDGQPIDPSEIVAYAAKPPVPPTEEELEEDAAAANAAATSNASNVPQKNYPSFGAIVRAGDATALSRFIKLYKEQDAWGKEKGDEMNALLYFAAELGHVDIAKVLITEGGAKIGKFLRGDTGMDDLMIAAAADKADMVEFLVENGANMKATSGNGQDALMHAAEFGAPEAIKKLGELNDKALRKLAAELREEEADNATIGKELAKKNILLELDIQNRNALFYACTGLGDKIKPEVAAKFEACVDALIALNISPLDEDYIDKLLPEEKIGEEFDAIFNRVADHRESYKPTDPMTYLGKPGEPQKKAGWGSRMFGG